MYLIILTVFYGASALNIQSSGLKKEIFINNSLANLDNTFGLRTNCEENCANVIRDIFSSDNQEKILDDIMLSPSFKLTTPKPKRNFFKKILKKLYRKHKYREPFYCYLQPSQIVPLWYFETDTERLESFSEENIMPVWRIIATEQLRKVDLYVRAVLSELKNGRNSDQWYLKDTVFGVDGVLKLQKRSDPHEWRDMYLSDAKSRCENEQSGKPVAGNSLAIPVPKIIYRKIELEFDNYRFSATVVVHNDPTPSAIENRLCSVQNELSGWDEIKNDDPITGLTYACHLDGDMTHSLRLNAIPYSENPNSKDTYPVYGVDKTPEIHKKYHHLLSLTD